MSSKDVFNPLWLRDPDFKRWVRKVPDNPRKASCTLCEKDFVIGDTGHRSLLSHASTPRHKMRAQMSSSLRHSKRHSPDAPDTSRSSSSSKDSFSQKQVSQLSRYERDDQLMPLLDNGWDMVDGRDAIIKTFHFQSFNEAWSWMSRVALAAERMGHHPEWFNVYNTVRVTWTTPECNGLSVRDVKMAHFCDSTFKFYK